MSYSRSQEVWRVVRDGWAWFRAELESDLDEWRSDQPVRRTVVGVLEVVFAIGILVRAGLHVGAVMIAYPHRFSEVEPEVQIGLQTGHTVVRDLPLRVDVSSRVTAAVYAGWWIQHKPAFIPLSPEVEALLTLYFGVNMWFVVLDPVWLVVDRVRSWLW